MTATLDTQLVAAVVQQLQVALPALLTTADLTQPTAILDYDPPLLDATATPLVWVDLTQDRRSTSEGRGTSIQKYSHEVTILVGIQVAGDDPSKAARLLRSYVQLVRQALEADAGLTGLVLWCKWQQTRYSPNLAKPGASLQKEAILSFDLNYRTTYRQD